MQEKILSNKGNGIKAIILILIAYIAAIVGIILSIVSYEYNIFADGIALYMRPVLIGVCIVWLALGWILLCGIKVLKPQEALVLTLFGKYIGTLKGDGIYYVNPFCVAVNPAANTKLRQSGDVDQGAKANRASSGNTDVVIGINKKISLKIMTLNNNRQKINDCLGNPIEIGIAVMWRVVNTAKAVFEIDNYKEYLSLQCDSALRNIVKIYPYDISPNIDTTGDGIADEGSLRGSSEIVAERIKNEIQQKVHNAGIEILEARITYLAYAPEIAAVMLQRQQASAIIDERIKNEIQQKVHNAGIEILEARITYLAYAPEIAAVMLQRQQASAIIDARKMIVDGAVGMVEMALDRLNQNNVVELDDERRAAMVSNLLVVLCGNHDAKPVINSGSLY